MPEEVLDDFQQINMLQLSGPSHSSHLQLSTSLLTLRGKNPRAMASVVENCPKWKILTKRNSFWTVVSYEPSKSEFSLVQAVHVERFHSFNFMMRPAVTASVRNMRLHLNIMLVLHQVSTFFLYFSVTKKCLTVISTC